MLEGRYARKRKGKKPYEKMDPKKPPNKTTSHFLLTSSSKEEGAPACLNVSNVDRNDRRAVRIPERNVWCSLDEVDGSLDVYHSMIPVLIFSLALIGSV